MGTTIITPSKTISKIVSISFIVIALLILIFFALIFVLYFGTPFDWRKNDQNMENFTRVFMQIPIPSDSKMIGIPYKGFGLQLGNSNHCDYMASYLLESSLSFAELQAYFRGYSVLAAAYTPNDPRCS